ncbi:MAG: ribosome-associated translation inhibitor RaiA [Rickettsiales bacterium]|nr:ribosome-associated translation inhibitor RaiA [Rickettsiales bacterium]
MEISVSGKGVDIGEAFQTHAQERLHDGLGKYLDRIVSADVTVSKEAHLFDVKIHANPGTASKIVVKSTGRSPDIYAAFELATEKAEKQLRRYKRRMTNHHKKVESDVIDFSTVQYTLDSSKHEEAPEDDQSDALVIAETAMDINTLTVSEAVMRMDLGELPALVFTNAANGQLNMLYRREDGNIAWIDPSKQKNGKAA